MGFTMWMAGGGVKGGVSVGQTDEIGSVAVEEPMHVRRRATVLNQLGLDPNVYCFFRGSIKSSSGSSIRPIREIIARTLNDRPHCLADISTAPGGRLHLCVTRFSVKLSHHIAGEVHVAGGSFGLGAHRGSWSAMRPSATSSRAKLTHAGAETSSVPCESFVPGTNT